MNRYLLIDDDEIITKIHPVIIRRVDPNCSIDICSTGLEALDFLNHMKETGGPPPDYIFLDINMPVMSGFELLDVLSNEMIDYLNKTNIILLSSSIDPGDVNKSRNYKFVKEFASKPLSIDYLIDLIKD